MIKKQTKYKTGKYVWEYHSYSENKHRYQATGSDIGFTLTEEQIKKMGGVPIEYKTI